MQNFETKVIQYFLFLNMELKFVCADNTQVLVISLMQDTFQVYEASMKVHYRYLY